LEGPVENAPWSTVLVDPAATSLLMTVWELVARHGRLSLWGLPVVQMDDEQ
jgi:hypothetical protein